jgi:hypothetical protein
MFTKPIDSKGVEIDLEDDEWDVKYVVNHKTYKQYLALSKARILNEGKFYSCSDGNLVNLSILSHVLREKIAHLPKQEQEDIESQHSQYRKAFGKMIQTKLHAYGRKAQPGQLNVSQVGQLKQIEGKRQELIELFGRMFSPEEVHKIVIEEFHLSCSLDVIVAFRKKYLEQITAKIEAFKRGAIETRLGIKKGRMEELVWLYQRVKAKYQSTDSRPDREFLLKLLDQLRKETDGDILKIEGNLDMKIESTVNIHLKQEVLSQLNLSQIIISRVAAKMGKNPLRMMAQLQNSLYSKFNGLVGDVVDADYEVVDYPSGHEYDFDEIARNYRMITKQDQQTQERLKQEEKDNAVVAKEVDVKEQLLSTIRSRKEENKLKGAQIDQFLLDQKIAQAEAKVKARSKQKTKKK